MVKKYAYNYPQIETLSLFPDVNKSLLVLLKSLNKDEWNLPTVVPGRTVKDLTAHLLDGSLRRLSNCRDNYQTDVPKIESYDDLVNYIQGINKSWIEATKRLSPQILIALLEFSEEWVYEYFKTLNPNDTAKYSVAWAGEMESQNWFDIAREYTEKWHHQMQIRLAVKKPGLDSKELFYPLIDTFMRGLPHAYRNATSAQNSGIQVNITGQGGGVWCLEKTDLNWQLVKTLKNKPEAIIEMSDNTAWQLFTDSMPKDVAIKSIKIHGNKLLGEVILNMRTTMR